MGRCTQRWQVTLPAQCEVGSGERVLGCDDRWRGDRLGVEAPERDRGFHRDLDCADGHFVGKRIGRGQRAGFRPRKKADGQRDGAEQSENPDVQCAKQILFPDSVRMSGALFVCLSGRLPVRLAARLVPAPCPEFLPGPNDPSCQ